MKTRYWICTVDEDPSVSRVLRGMGFWRLVWFVLFEMRRRIQQGYRVEISGRISHR